MTDEAEMASSRADALLVALAQELLGRVAAIRAYSQLLAHGPEALGEDGMRALIEWIVRAASRAEVVASALVELVGEGRPLD